MTSLNIKAGFRTTGIYPLDRNAVAIKIQKPIMDTDASKNELHFLRSSIKSSCKDLREDMKLNINQMKNTSVGWIYIIHKKPESFLMI